MIYFVSTKVTFLNSKGGISTAFFYQTTTMKKT